MACACGSTTSLAPAPPAGDASTHSTLDAGDSSVATCADAPWVVFGLVRSDTLPAAAAYSLYAVHPDGSGSHTLALPHPSARSPSVSRDGTSIVTMSPTRRSLYVYRFGAASDVTLATDGAVGQGSFSPDGTRVAYDDGTSLFTVAADGTGAPLYVPVDSTVMLSPAGAYAAFTADSSSLLLGSYSTLWSVAIHGPGMKAVVTNTGPSAAANPALSPDARSLATIVSPDGITFTLRTYAFAERAEETADMGAIVTRVPEGAAGGVAAWGPTGLIAYSDGTDIFLVSANGGTPMNLTADNDAAELATEPTWAPGCTEL